MSLGTLMINRFDNLTAKQQTGSNHAVHQQAVDDALQSIGN